MIYLNAMKLKIVTELQ